MHLVDGNEAELPSEGRLYQNLVSESGVLYRNFRAGKDVSILTVANILSILNGVGSSI